MKLKMKPAPMSPEIDSEATSQSARVFDVHVEGTAFGQGLQAARYGSSAAAAQAADFVVDHMTASLKRLADN
jgi:hypothetical protein